MPLQLSGRPSVQRAVGERVPAAGDANAPPGSGGAPHARGDLRRTSPGARSPPGARLVAGPVAPTSARSLPRGWARSVAAPRRPPRAASPSGQPCRPRAARTRRARRPPARRRRRCARRAPRRSRGRSPGPRPAPPSRAGARGVGAVEAVEHAVALLGRDAGPVVLDGDLIQPRGRAADAQRARARPGAVCSTALRARLRSDLGEAVRVGAQRPLGHRRRARSGGRRSGVSAVEQLGRRTGRSSTSRRTQRARPRRRARAAGGRRRAAPCARSRCARGASTRRTSSARDARLAREHLELAADHGQRRAQLVRGVGDEAALAREGVLEPVEHVVEGVGEHAHLVRAGRAVPIRGERSPPSTARRGARHPPQRPRRRACASAKPSSDRGQQRRRPASEERRARRRLRARHRPARADSPTPIVATR